MVAASDIKDICMYDTIRCALFSGTVTLFASVPEIFEMPMERISFGALLFFIIWTYMKKILPKTHEEMQKLREENRKLVEEIRKLNDLREHDQRIIGGYIRGKCDKIDSGQITEKEPPYPDSEKWDKQAHAEFYGEED